MTLAEDLKRTMEHPRNWSDAAILTATREILEQNPEDQDDSLDPEHRAMLQKCRKIMKRRDSEPTTLRALK